MATDSELTPHVVYHKETSAGTVCATYAEAFTMWKMCHAHEPYAFQLATLGRHCTPAAEIVDVSE